MNPSAQGWILKYDNIIQHRLLVSNNNELYLLLRKFGFIYGVNIEFPSQIETQHTFSVDEKAKINLLFALHQTFLLQQQSSSFSEFLAVICDFYVALGISKKSDTQKTIKKQAVILEKNITRRVYIDTNLFTKNFSNQLINIILYTDVLLFRAYLKNKENIIEKAKTIEKILLELVLQTLNSKTEKNTYDKNLIGLFTASVSFQKEASETNESNQKNDYKQFNNCTLHYFLDICTLTTWSDEMVEPYESQLLEKFARQFGFPKEEVTQSVIFLKDFFAIHKKDISHLKSSNYVLNFYDNTTQMVQKLIVRNKKRLLDELYESKELLSLITKSTTEELTKEEKKKIKNQLLDICKVVPSLAIFLLPGGGILLPIFIKLIPNILPSSFNDNRTE